MCLCVCVYYYCTLGLIALFFLLTSFFFLFVLLFLLISQTHHHHHHHIHKQIEQQTCVHVFACVQIVIIPFVVFFPSHIFSCNKIACLFFSYPIFFALPLYFFFLSILHSNLFMFSNRKYYIYILYTLQFKTKSKTRYTHTIDILLFSVVSLFIRPVSSSSKTDSSNC